jgi:hypothetical protein
MAINASKTNGWSRRQSRFIVAGTLLLFLTAARVRAQQNDAAFWNSPDKEEKDARGNVTYAEHRNKQTNTIHVVQDGQSYVYHYDPLSQRIVGTDAGETRETYKFGRDGRMTDLTVRLGTQSFSVSQSRDGGLQAGGLPPLSFQRDHTGRDEAVLSAGDVALARVLYSDTGYVRSLAIDENNYRLNFEQASGQQVFTERLTTHDGKLLASATVAAGKVARSFAMCLDPLLKRLGLTESWPNEILLFSNPTNTLTTVRLKRGTVIAYLVEIGENRVGFDREGKALFYDVKLNFADLTPHEGSDAILSVTTDMASVVPDRVMYTVDRQVAAYVEEVASGAISSLWTEALSNGRSSIQYRTITAVDEKEQ